jgi:rhodanese-related sulfurtransferase
MIRALHQTLATPALAAFLLLALAGCESSTKSPGESKADAANFARSDGATTSRSPDVRLAQDTAAPSTPTPDAAQTRADVVIPDTALSGRDAARDSAALSPDTWVVVDSTPPRADTAVRGDAALRVDTLAPDSAVKPSDAEMLACTIVDPAPAMGHLSPKELKAILDSSEDPYLINVKGTSIANIPGTDAVLASDVPGIEALVGGKLCANIILYCRSGATSQTVGNQLVAKGYQHVRDLSGGINAWTAAGYLTE